MKTILVPDMMCSHCQARIEKALAAEGMTCTVNLDRKTVLVEEKDVARAVEAIADLGFEPEAKD